MLTAEGGLQSTTARLLDHYHTYNRRPSVWDPVIRSTIFKSLERTLGAWLPADRATPILDIGCGEGAALCFLRERGYVDLAGFDLSPENVAACRQLGLGFVLRGDALRLGEYSGPKRYGMILALDVLEHLPRERAATFLENMRSLLLPGGCAIIQVPNLGSHLGWFHQQSDLTHEFGLTEHSALSLLAAAGFAAGRIELRAAWSATTLAGHLREAYMRVLHFLVWAPDGAGRPRIPTRDLLIRAAVP
jgi:SAM-dependent methyltransferase